MPAQYAAPGRRPAVGVFGLLHSAVIPSRIPPKENPPPDRPAPVHRRAFKMASGIEVLHGRYIKGACLGTLAGEGWHWSPSACSLCAFLAYALRGLGFETLPEKVMIWGVLFVLET